MGHHATLPRTLESEAPIFEQDWPVPVGKHVNEIRIQKQLEVNKLTRRTRRATKHSRNSGPKNGAHFLGSNLAPPAGPQTVCGPAWGAKIEDHFSGTILGPPPGTPVSVPSSCAGEGQKAPCQSLEPVEGTHTRVQHRGAYTDSPPEVEASGGESVYVPQYLDSCVSSYYRFEALERSLLALACTRGATVTCHLPSRRRTQRVIRSKRVHKKGRITIQACRL